MQTGGSHEVAMPDSAVLLALLRQSGVGGRCASRPLPMHAMQEPEPGQPDRSAHALPYALGEAVTATLSVDFEYTIGQRVEIRALERPAIVRLVRYDGNQPDYFVSWWDEGKRQSEWMPADELRLPRLGAIP
jgi:hypothetical protein